jgi:para-nitrobenzyl esterase
MKTVKVSVEQGILEGELKGGCMIFRGVPYAKAPVGDLRFKAPQDPDHWTGVRPALEYGAICPQYEIKDGFYGKEFYTDPKYPTPAMSEDCLFLNIWAPETKKGDGYPVAFWIHGGAFDHGFSNEMEFDGMQYALRDTILVSINYRVGVFGFMALEDLRREDANKSVGNYGILDQIKALKWVRKNIEQFGGDPDRITVFGQSAGALSTQTLISSPLTRGMIHAAIMQSGAGSASPLIKDVTPEEAYKVGKKVMDTLNVRYVRELRNVPAEKLVSVLPELYKEFQGLCFSPVKDGWVLTENYQECIDNDHIHDIPYMIGCTRNDITIEEGEDGRKSALFKGCVDFAEQRIFNSDEPVYVYYFARKLPGDEAGSFHSSELWYMFGTLDRCWRPMERHDYTLSMTMLDMWTDFMKKADPGRGWKAYTEKDHFIRQLM